MVDDKQDPIVDAGSSGLLDDLWSRAQNGDEHALAVLRAMSPKRVPRVVIKQERDERLRQIALWMRESIPNLTMHAVAKILKMAGLHLLVHRHLPSTGLFAKLSDEERVRLEQEVRTIISWNRPDQTVRWPKARQMQRILKETSVTPAPL